VAPAIEEDSGSINNKEMRRVAPARRTRNPKQQPRRDLRQAGKDP
jgi:hypothetical protein